MKVLVIGANGRTGTQIVKQLSQNSISLIAGIHSRNHINSLNTYTDKIVVIDIVSLSVNELIQKIRDLDVNVIIFASGASQDGPDMAVWIDQDGAIKLMQAAKKANIKHFIMISAAGAERRATWNIYDIPLYYLAKYYAEDYLRKSGLNYTVIRPAMLTDAPATGNVSSNDSSTPFVSRQDVALVAFQALQNSRLKNIGFNLYGGTTPINDLNPTDLNDF